MKLEEFKKIIGDRNIDLEININKEEYNTDEEIDEWGCAYVWVDNLKNGNDYGVELNYCIQKERDGSINNCCAIYECHMDKDDKFMGTDYDKYIHYEINWKSDNWKEELLETMLDVFVEFNIK